MARQSEFGFSRTEGKNTATLEVQTPPGLEVKVLKRMHISKGPRRYMTCTWALK